MGVILVSGGVSGGGNSDHTHSNLASLNAISVTSDNGLKVNGVKVGEKAVELSLNRVLSATDITNKYIELPNDCDTSRAITVVLDNVPQRQGAAWEVIENAAPIPDRITWAGLTLESKVMVDDPIVVTYYKKEV